MPASLRRRPRLLHVLSAPAGRRFAVAVVAALSLASAGTPVAAAPKCFGAAARDPQHPCSNPTRSVTPLPADAPGPPASPCRPVKQRPEPICTFGASSARAGGHVALIGDSHALHWRAAVDVVADAMRWQGFSITTAGCPFSAAVEYLPEGLREPCVEWYRSVLKWFGDHPQVSTVFVSQNAPTPVVVAPGQTYLGVKVAGYRRAWGALPETVRRVIVIRDTPITSDATFDCVRQVIAAGRERAGPACPLSRSVALRWDTAVAAARIPSRRYRFVDLTEHFCNRRNCYPVVGGVLVHRDIDHITLAFAKSLGPYLLRKVRRLPASS